MRRFRALIILLILFLILLIGCRREEIFIRKLKIERLYTEPDHKDYSQVFVDPEMSGEWTIFTSNFDLENLELWAIDFIDENLEEVELIESYFLGAGQDILFDLVYPEGIPSFKLKWSVDGREDEYIFQYNGRDGGEDLIEITYD